MQMFEGTVPRLEDLVSEDGGCSYCGGSLRLHEDAVLLHIIPSGEWRCVADMRVHRCEGWFDREHSGPREAARIRPLPRGCRPTRPSSPRKTYYSSIRRAGGQGRGVAARIPRLKNRSPPPRLARPYEVNILLKPPVPTATPALTRVLGPLLP